MTQFEDVVKSVQVDNNLTVYRDKDDRIVGIRLKIDDMVR